jgi:NitT/TauT family transport system ATP-binding protein
VFVTHDLEEAILLSDRIFALSQGVVESIVEVPFPRPRTDELRVGVEVQETKKVLWKYLGGSPAVAGPCGRRSWHSAT